MKNSTFKNIIFSFLPVLIVAVLGSVFVNIGSVWFSSLNTPSEWVPNFLIPIVWTIIYLISAIILYLSLSKNNLDKSSYILFLINGILNVLWCLVFFTLEQKFLGLVVIILNLIFAWILLKKLFKQNKLYAYLLFIYPLWLSIATTLNLAVWILN